ncbi:MAG: hypothetical protein Q4G63_03720 [Bacteroidia bacterium]|nr:hypothetical protein [Bacteroidia bacterium]
MKYQATILNVFLALSIAAIITTTILKYKELSDGEGWGIVAMVGFLSIAFVGVVIDLIIQILTQRITTPKKRSIVRNLLGFIILSVFLFCCGQDIFEAFYGR